MSMMTSKMLKFVDLRKTQKSEYLDNEIQFFLQIKNFIHLTYIVYIIYHLGYTDYIILSR